MPMLISISAERSIEGNYAFHQHQKVYSFCAQFVKGKTVLDIGCGWGKGAYSLAKFAKKVEAVDKDPEIIRQNRLKFRLPNLNFACINFERFETEEKFDVVVGLQFIEHVKNPDFALKRIKRLLKKNSLLILSTPNKLQSSFNLNPYHFKEFESKELGKLLGRHFNAHKVKIYGLYGDEIVQKYESLRQKQVSFILKLDKLRLLRFLPKFILRYLFNISSYLIKTFIVKKNNEFSKISESNYELHRKTQGALDLIVFCNA